MSEPTLSEPPRGGAANSGKLQPGWPLLLFFLSLSMVVMLAHELTHHLAARAVCGAWGTITWSIFALSPGCAEAGKPWWIATLAGPLLTYALIWVGALWRSPLGLALLFANLPAGRIINVATKSGDELVVGRVLLGEQLAWAAMAVVVAILLGWPLWQAWRRLPHRRRGSIFAALLFLPLFWDLLFKRMLLGRFLPLEPAAWGIPAALIAVLVLAALTAVATLPTRSAKHRAIEVAPAGAA